MPTVADFVAFLESFAPSHLAAEWDNVGLLSGDPARPVRRAMTCLSITPASAAEAIAAEAELIVAHHPLPFQPLRRLTTESTAGRLLWELTGAGIAIYSPHTAFDSARDGINQRLARGLALVDIAPLVPAPLGPAELGTGRIGRLAQAATLGALAERVKRLLAVPRAEVVGALERPVERVAIVCGSGGELLEAALAAGSDVFVTGEARFHTCLEAEAQNIGLVLAGHYATERFAVEELAGVLAREWPEIEVWASREERDPSLWV